jgi:hypothetical protein
MSGPPLEEIVPALPFLVAVCGGPCVVVSPDEKDVVEYDTTLRPTSTDLECVLGFRGGEGTSSTSEIMYGTSHGGTTGSRSGRRIILVGDGSRDLGFQNVVP